MMEEEDPGLEFFSFGFELIFSLGARRRNRAMGIWSGMTGQQSAAKAWMLFGDAAIVYLYQDPIEGWSREQLGRVFAEELGRCGEGLSPRTEKKYVDLMLAAGLFEVETRRKKPTGKIRIARSIYTWAQRHGAREDPDWIARRAEKIEKRAGPR